jgi:hypothetical protein
MNKTADEMTRFSLAQTFEMEDIENRANPLIDLFESDEEYCGGNQSTNVSVYNSDHENDLDDLAIPENPLFITALKNITQDGLKSSYDDDNIMNGLEFPDELPLSRSSACMPASPPRTVSHTPDISHDHETIAENPNQVENKWAQPSIIGEDKRHDNNVFPRGHNNHKVNAAIVPKKEHQIRLFDLVEIGSISNMKVPGTPKSINSNFSSEDENALDDISDLEDSPENIPVRIIESKDLQSTLTKYREENDDMGFDSVDIKVEKKPKPSVRLTNSNSTQFINVFRPMSLKIMRKQGSSESLNMKGEKNSSIGKPPLISPHGGRESAAMVREALKRLEFKKVQRNQLTG